MIKMVAPMMGGIQGLVPKIKPMILSCADELVSELLTPGTVSSSTAAPLNRKAPRPTDESALPQPVWAGAATGGARAGGKVAGGAGAAHGRRVAAAHAGCREAPDGASHAVRGMSVAVAA
jgi:hypothetical protein